MAIISICRKNSIFTEKYMGKLKAFAQGFLSVYSFGYTLSGYCEPPQLIDIPEEPPRTTRTRMSDFESIASDWQMVGQDLCAAMYSYEQTQE